MLPIECVETVGIDYDSRNWAILLQHPRLRLLDRLTHNIRSLPPANEFFELVPALDPLPRSLRLFWPGWREGFGGGSGRENEEFERVDGRGNEIGLRAIFRRRFCVRRAVGEREEVGEVEGAIRKQSS